ncbi:hypothetical protein Tco_0630560, partial [Tanacetum coccineum]
NGFACLYSDYRSYEGEVGKQQRVKDETKLLDTTVGRVVPLLPVAPACALSELEACMDKLFDEGGSSDQAEQRDSANGGQGVGIQLVSEAVEIVAEDVAPFQPRRQKKRKTTVVDAGEPSHLAKKLKDDHGTPGGVSVGVRGGVVPTLPFMTSSVFATPEHEGEDHTDSMAGTTLQTVGPPQRFVISSDSFHHSGANVTEAKVDYVVRSSVLMMTVATTVTSIVDLAGGADHTMGGFSNLTGCDFIVSGILLSSVLIWIFRRMEHNQLFTEFNVRAARQMSLSDEVKMHAEYNIKEKRRLKYVEAEAAKAIRLRAEASMLEAVEKSLQDEVQVLREFNATLEKEKNDLDIKVANLAASVKVRERDVTDLDDVVTSVKSQNDNLIDQARDDQIKEVNDKFDKLYTDFVEMALHLEERFYPHLLSTIFGRRWLLTHGMELAITRCTNYPEYLSVLGTAIGKDIEKGMQNGLSAGITHGKEGRAIIDVAAYNPSTKADYIFALQQLQHVNFSLFTELRSNKDASIEDLMNILHLEDTLIEKLGLGELQPHVDQLMVPIHLSSEKTIIGATALSLALDVSNIRVQKIWDNIPNYRSAFCDVFIPLAEPLSAVALEGMEGTLDAVTLAATTTALSTTLVSTSSVNPIFIDNYEVVEADDQAAAGVNDASFPNVDDVDLHISQ